MMWRRQIFHRYCHPLLQIDQNSFPYYRRLKYLQSIFSRLHFLRKFPSGLNFDIKWMIKLWFIYKINSRYMFIDFYIKKNCFPFHYPFPFFRSIFQRTGDVLGDDRALNLWYLDRITATSQQCPPFRTLCPPSYCLY